MAGKASLQFGKLEIDSDFVRRGTYNIVTSRIWTPFEFADLDPIPGESLSTAFTKSMLSLSYTGKLLLCSLVAFRNRNPEEHKGKLYSLMGLFPDSNHLVGIDYTVPTEQLLQDFTLAWIQKHQEPRVLGHLHDPARRVNQNMPLFAVDGAPTIHTLF